MKASPGLVRLGLRGVEFISGREVESPREDGYALKRWMRVDSDFRVRRKLEATLSREAVASLQLRQESQYSQELGAPHTRRENEMVGDHQSTS